MSNEFNTTRTFRMSGCLFCKIVKKEIPCLALAETDKSLAFLDIGPLSKGHVLVIPKKHGEKFHDLDEESLIDLLPTAQKIVKRFREMGLCEDYNILQNNGALAHQEVKHVHFHIIPKTESEGLGISWPTKSFGKEELSAFQQQFLKK